MRPAWSRNCDTTAATPSSSANVSSIGAYELLGNGTSRYRQLEATARIKAGAMVALILLRSLLLATLEAPESRYTLECFPLLFVFAACYFSTRVVPGGSFNWKTSAAIGKL